MTADTNFRCWPEPEAFKNGADFRLRGYSEKICSP